MASLHNPLNGELVEANLHAKLEEMFGTCNVIFDKVFNQIAQLNTEFNKKASAYQKDIADLTQEFLKLKQENAKADQKAITTQKDIADLKQQLADLKQELKNAI
jgi:septal ring factor EnvC (AmiA/AmiB activator)